MKLNLGIRRRLAPLLDNDRSKLALVHSLLFTLPGSPTLYYGDEIGMGHNLWLKDRDGMRTPMQWTKGKNAGFSKAEPDALYSMVIETPPYDPEHVNVKDQLKKKDNQLALVKHMISVRTEHEAFCLGGMEWATTNADRHVLAYWRQWEEERILVVNNLSNKTRKVRVDLLEEIIGVRAEDLFSGESLGEIQGRSLRLELGPRGYAWLKVS
jgi:maltose alpha-D-glucosyltransferase/alpha-amylase